MTKSNLLALALLAVGILLFCKGFLLVRKITTDKNIEKPPMEGKFKKAVILLFDAVRFDMVLPDAASKEPWRNHFNILHEMHSHSPSNSILFRFKADPPTATTQRLAGLTAGNLPTFIEVGDNFSGHASPQDNWVHQLINAGKRMHFLGDDTWLHMYPFLQEQRNATVKGYHSFHLFDLDTVDNAIEAEIYNLLERNDHDVLVAHYLGMDHCGHKYGPAHVLCAKKLQQYNEIVKKVILSLNEDTLLVAMSDHGMTDDGDHGGVSPKETSAFLFMHATKANFVDTERFAQLAELREADVDAKDLDFFDNQSNVRTVEQVDFCPTLSVLLGLPIPFGNLGKVIPEVFAPLSIQELTSLMRYNLKQMQSFLSSMKDIKVELRSIDMFTEMYKEASKLLKVARSLWSQFNYKLMLTGLLISSLGVVLLSASNSLTMTIFSFGYAILLSTTSFIVFEEWVVRFSITAFLLMRFLKNRSEWKALLVSALVVRLSYLFGQCREEQFPFCKVLSHRSVEPSALAISLITVALLVLAKKKLTSLLLMIWWSWNWLKDHNRAPAQVEGIMTLWYPRFLMLSSLSSLPYFLGIFQRPFAGMLFLIGTSLMKEAEQDYNLSGDVQAILTAMMWFFVVGHQATVTGIQWEFAFVGHESSFKPLQVAQLTLNTFAGHFMTMRWDERFLQRSVLFHGVSLVGMSLFCMLLIRHLMIWKIFGPRFLFQIMQFAFYAVAYLGFIVAKHVKSSKLLIRTAKQQIKT